MNIYQTLGIASNADSKEIRRAYARLIKEFRPETHPVEFGNIREAYEIALANFAAAQAEAEAAQVEAAQAGAAQLGFTSPLSAPTEAISAAPEARSAYAGQDAQFDPIQYQAIQQQVNYQPAQYTDLPPEPAAETPLHPVLQYLQQLEDCAVMRNENKAQAQTQAFLAGLGQYSLDEAAAIEVEVLNWVFNTPAPLLLSYLELDAFYKWTESAGFSRREFNAGEHHWLSNLKLLAETYQNALLKQDANLAGHKQRLPDFLLSDADIAERKQWQARCENLGLPALAAYFKPAPGTAFPVRRQHLLYASVAALLAGLLVEESAWLTAMYAAIAFAIMLAITTYLLPLYRIYMQRGKSNARKYFGYLLLFYFLFGVGRALLSQDNEVTNNWARDLAREQVQQVTDPVQSMVGPTICTGKEQRPAPEYPVQSMRNRETGKVKVLLLVDVDGSVIDAQITESSGHHRLDQASLDAARRWCFEPVLKQGQAQKFSVTAPFSYAL